MTDARGWGNGVFVGHSRQVIFATVEAQSVESWYWCVMTKIEFNPPEFRPARMLRNRHLQTVTSAWSFAGRRPSATARQIIELPDGDQLVIHDDCPADWKAGDPATLVIHGLAGCHDSPYMNRLARKLTGRGIRSMRLDLRGAGAGELLATKSYHCGCSEDITAAIRAIQPIIADSPLFAVGFSLGGNALLKAIGEADDRLVTRAMAVCPPLNMIRSSALLQRGFNRVYDKFFARMLYKRLRRRSRGRSDVDLLGLSRRPKTLRELDDQYTAPLWGFASVDDYYRRSSAAPLISQIETPTIILTADDDPLVPAATFRELPPHPLVQVAIVRGGGHTGFVGRGGLDADRQWLEWRIVELAKQLSAGDEDSRLKKGPS